MLKLVKKSVGCVVNRIINSQGGISVFLRAKNAEENRIITVINTIRDDSRNSLTRFEYFHLYNILSKTEKIDGDVAEVGVFKGGSAKLICETTRKQTYLFDTFEGLPEISKLDNKSQFGAGDYSATLEDVKKYLSEYKNILFFKGIFPSTATTIQNNKFSFVHLDVDLYQSTLDCLTFFYPRMVAGGVILSHDYVYAPGVKKAFDDFFKNKTEIIIEPLTGSSQCFIIKI